MSPLDSILVISGLMASHVSDESVQLIKCMYLISRLVDTGLCIKMEIYLLHFVAFSHVASLFSTRVDNEKVGIDNEKALELTNSTVFHRGRQ